MRGYRFSPETEAALAAFLAERDLVHGPLTVRPVGDGHSNLTYLVTGDTTVVLRRPPPPPFPRGAHDVLREARVIAGLAGTDVPAPAVLAEAPAGVVFDVPCFVMAFVPGAVMTDRSGLPDPKSRRAVADGLVAALAAIHRADPASSGLRVRPGSTARTLDRFRALAAGDAAEPPTAFRAIEDRLRASLPADTDAVLLHNDFRLGNVLVDGRRIAAVLDWELASTGDPLADLGYLLATWPEPARPLTPIEEFGRAALEPGFPDRPALADRYAALTGRDLAALPWFVAFANWKLAALYEYNRRRVLSGIGDDYYADPGHVAAFLEAASNALEG